MRKCVSTVLAVLLVLSALSAFAATTDRDTVKQVQQALNDAGYDCGTPDGVAGKKTSSAIRQYQGDKALEVTGEIDDRLLAALGLTETPAAETAGEEAIPEPEARAAAETDPQTGYPVIAFGRWQIDLDFENTEDGKDPIEWLVLENDGKKALLLSRYILMDTNFHYVYGRAEGKDWSKCTLRSYLNGDFYENAFVKDEQKAIRKTTLKNPAGPETKTKGKESKDRLFLLSYGELEAYFPSKESRAALCTAFADSLMLKSADGSIRPDSWWLRTPGMNIAKALVVATDGGVDLDTGDTTYNPRGIRPAMWVDVEGVPALR
ncbi:MAG: DUF6273 domain-containing protein [Christensenellales bacterium]